MPVNRLSVSQNEATQIVNSIIQKAVEDGGKPIAVAVVDAAARLVVFTAIDGIMPASIKLAQTKAYSAVMGARDTIQWANTKKNASCIDFDMRNWTDENFTAFTGGVIIFFQGLVIGAVAVSGRKGKKDETDELMQDNELAEFGKSIFEKIQQEEYYNEVQIEK